MLATKTETAVRIAIPQANQWKYEDGSYSVAVEIEKYDNLRLELESIPEYITGIRSSNTGRLVLIANSLAGAIESFLTFTVVPNTVVKKRRRT